MNSDEKITREFNSCICWNCRNARADLCDRFRERNGAEVVYDFITNHTKSSKYPGVIVVEGCSQFLQD